MKIPEDLTGKIYSRLTVIKKYGLRKNGVAIWECKCECGNISRVNGSQLKSGRIKSCGCHRINRMSKLNLGHGLRGHYIYNIWRSIKKRCYDPKHKSYKDYGGRGIIMDSEWIDDVEAFFKHIGEKPTSKHQVDRKNNDGNYVPGNVRWATATQQARNRRSNVYGKIGKYSMTGELLKIYELPGDAEKEENLGHSGLYRCLSGKIKFHKGFIWRNFI